MQKTEPDRLFRFGVFELDPRAGELRSKGSRVKLQDQPLQILLALLEKPGQIVTRQELRAKLWQADTFVDFDHGLNAAVKRLRDALGDTAENPRYIETLPRHGYRFIAAKEPDAVQVQKRQSPPRRRGLPVAVAALLSIVAVLFAANAGGLRSKLFSGSAAQPHIRSLAVLPFTNLSGDPQQEYFADAMTEELITELSRIDSLKVISRTSVMQYKGQKKPLPQIGRELNVDALMEGSVLRFGNRVRIAVQLIYAPTDQHVWVETYDRDLGDLLKLQGEIAEAITQQIRLKLTPEQLVGLRRAREVNPEAYQAYLTAVSFDWSRFQGIKAAQTYFEKAIQKDPDFADAYLGLAGSYRRLGEFRWLSPQDAYPPGKQALRKALELDERNCRPHLQLGWLAWQYDWDWQTAEREYKYAIELCPNVAGVYWEYAFYLGWSRRDAEASAEMARAHDLDPLGPAASNSRALVVYHLHNYIALTEVSRQFVAVDANRWLAHYWLGVGYEGSGQTLQAIPEYQKAVELSQGDQDPTAALAHAYAATGKRAEAQKILHEFLGQSESRYVSPYMIATVYAGLGDKNKAFEYLGKAYQEKSSDLPYFLRADLRLDTLRSDPRFRDLLRRMNFPK